MQPVAAASSAGTVYEVHSMHTSGNTVQQRALRTVVHVALIALRIMLSSLLKMLKLPVALLYCIILYYCYYYTIGWITTTI
jgi:hypothetical protein